MSNIRRYSFFEITEKAKLLFYYITGGDDKAWSALDEPQRSYYRLKFLHENEDES